MKAFFEVIKRFSLVPFIFIFSFVLFSEDANATSQWARKFGMSCSSCHTIFPRLNSFGEEFLKNGYQLMSTYKKNWEDAYPVDAGGVLLDDVTNLFGVRLNMTPIMLETNSLQKDSLSDKTTRITLGEAIWAQLFVAGSIYKDISFFSELEYSKSSFKFNWFYFNFTNLMGSEALNFQVGFISPLEFASYPNRLPTLPALKGQVMLVKSSNGKGEESVDMSSARPGIQYYGRNEWATLYAGVSPGTSAREINQFVNLWGGLVLKLPESLSRDLGGSSATIHYYRGTDTKGTGTPLQIENQFSRISPQINLRWRDLDLQAAYVMGTDDNWLLIQNPTGDFKFNGFALEAGYFINPTLHFAVHYDNFSSDEIAGVKVFDFQKVVPALTYIINENIRFTIYYEADLTDIPSDTKVNKAYLNIRTMF